jgi:hypothetical protein
MLPIDNGRTNKMSDDKDPELQAAEYLLELARRKGISTFDTKNGRMLAFTRTFLTALLNAHPGKEEFMIFIEAEQPNKPQN